MRHIYIYVCMYIYIYVCVYIYICAIHITYNMCIYYITHIERYNMCAIMYIIMCDI